LATFQSSIINKDRLRHGPSAIALLNTNFVLIDASTNWLNLFGFKVNEINGKNWFAIFPDLSADWKIRLEHTLYGVQDIKILDKVTLKDGTIKHFIWRLDPWKDSDGKHHGIVIRVVNPQ